MPIVTRFRPKRADELVGGSLYWIVKHRIAARQTILGFDERDVRPARRSSGSIPSWCRCARCRSARHQGWRYLDAGRRAARSRRRAATAWTRCRRDLAGKLAVLALI